MKKSLVLGSLLLSMVAFGKDYTQYKSDKLVSAEVAKQMIERDKNVVIIDVRPEAKFLIGNVEGSYSMWRPDMEPKDNRYGEIGGMRASREEIETELNKMGVTKDSTLILIGDNLDEYRLWWILDMYGMENVKVVDGGYSALKEVGVKTRFGKEATEKQGDFKFTNNPDKDTLATIETVESAINNPRDIIVDTRSKKEFTGEELKKGAVVKGRIPGSVWVEWTEVLNSDKTMKSYDELVALYNKQGVTPDKEVLPYCQSAVRSAHTTFVLKELLGYPVVKNYDGSWIEWSYAAKDGKVKVETGE
ncbi:MAG: sulfurtransferase [Cetobacterium sp.]|uniref:sulfurtransferase n=1 Tax=Cetobacterium sp. TaxID=2071632 RepID=UPI003F38D005